MPYSKMIFCEGGFFKPVKAKCNCGKIHEFKMKSLKPGDTTTTFNLNIPFKCESCGITYELISGDTSDIIYEKHTHHKQKKYSIVGISALFLIMCALFFGGYKIISPIVTDVQNNNSPTSINDMTNKEYNQFVDWKDKQKQKKLENQKVNE